MTSASPLNRLLEKVKDLVPTPPQEEKEEKNEKDALPAEPAEKKEKGSSNCPHHFGYLAKHPKKSRIPEECLTCQKMLECRTS